MSYEYSLSTKFPLTNEQNEICEYMLQRPTAICAAQTGYGKTYTMCTCLIHLLKNNPDGHAIILAPVKAMKAFRKELKTKLEVQFNELISSKSEIKPGCRITLITHTALSKYINYFTDLVKSGKKIFLLIDECHVLECPDSKIYNQVASIRHLCTVFWGATATPLKNNIEGLFHLMYLLDPNIFRSYANFKYNFLRTQLRQVMCTVGKGRAKRKAQRTIEEIVGYKNLDILKKTLANYIILKQKKYNLNFYYHKIDLTKDEEDAYMKAAKGSMRESSKDHAAVRLHDLQKVVDNIEESTKNEKVLSSKEKLLIKVLQYRMQHKNPCLVYCDYNDGIDRLEYIIKGTANYTGVKRIYKITGDVPQKERESVEDLIDETTVVLITSAGTESINLQKADTLIFYDIPFNIATFLQAVGRVTRMDSKFSCQHIHMIEAFGTIDTYKRCLIQLNGKLIQDIFGDIETLPVEMSSIDKKMVSTLRNGLLWTFKNGRMIKENELDILLSKFVKDL